MTIINEIKQNYKYGGIAQKIIFWNVGIFILSLFFFYQFKLGGFNYPNWLALPSSFSNFITTPYTLLTYSFLHSGFLHLLFNMMVLHFSAQLFATFFTEKQFIAVYFLGGLFSGSIFLISHYLLGYTSSILVGASGAIMAVLFATATYAPYMQVKLALIGNVKLWHITAVLILLDVIQLPISNFGGHIAHLAGGFFGFIYIKMLQNGTDMAVITNKIIHFFYGLQHREKKKFKKVYKNKTAKKATTVTFSKEKQQKIDDILDKISKNGYENLTKEEKQFLFNSKTDDN